MRKPELAEAIAERTDLTKAKATEVLNALTDEIAEVVARNDAVTLIGFGTFSPQQRKARTGINPQTGAAIEIAASKSVTFKAGKALKKALNEA